MLRADVELALSPFAIDVAIAAPHRVTGLFGPSGAGKTSLLEVVIGLRRGARGRVELDGETWLDSERAVFVAPEERGIGYVPQEGLLFPHLDVRGNLLAGAPGRARRPGPEGAAAELARVCRLLEIDALLDRAVATLSAGQRQRVALARAVCSRPRLLVLDEPLASLELPLRRRILPFLRRLRDELALPILYVSHEPLEIQALADDVVVLREGRVVAQGPPARVLADPEVFALAPDEEYENVLVARALQSADGEGREVELAPGLPFRVPAFPGDAGATVLVAIPAQQVLLAIEPPRGLSAQNVLRAVVRDVRPAGALRLVASELARGGPELVAEVTPRACVDLDLRSGREVFLIVKQTGCRVYAAGDAAEANDR